MQHWEKSMASDCIRYCSAATTSNVWLDGRVIMLGTNGVVSEGSQSHIKAWSRPCFAACNRGWISPRLRSSFTSSGFVLQRPTRKDERPLWEYSRKPLVLPLFGLPKPPLNWRSGELRDKQNRNNPITSNGQAHDKSIWGGSTFIPPKACFN